MRFGAVVVLGWLIAASAGAGQAAETGSGTGSGAPLGRGDDGNVDDLLARARLLRLGDDLEWRRLLHYHPLKSRPGVVASHVSDDRYFLSDAGRRDSQAELEASIMVLLGPGSDDLTGFEIDPEADFDEALETGADRHPRCRFVEREKWLRAKLDMPAAAVPTACVNYHNWRTTLDAHSIKLIFPAAYLNSPSSMFGHTLLRLDPKNIDDDSPLLSWSLNFSAEVGVDAEHSIGYAFKGITGAYPGKFHVIPYFKKLQEYGAIENRDIWEYGLALEDDEVDRLVDHVWELRDIKFDYYFFRENCSFRLLELLDYARPSLNLASNFKWTAIPADTLRSVVDAELVSSTRYRPSLGTELQYKLSAMDSEQQRLTGALAEDPAAADSRFFLDSDPDVQRRMVQAASQLLTYRTRKATIDEAGVDRRFRMLQLIAKYPVDPASPVPEPPLPHRAEQGHETVLVSIGGGSVEDVGFAEATLRLTYHDVLDRPVGYIPGGGIVLGRFRLRSEDAGDTRVEAADIVEIRSVAARHPLFGGLSWGVDVGFRRDPFLERNALSFRVGGLAGKSIAVGGASQVFALAGPSLNVFHDRQYDGYLNAHARLGWLAHHRAGTTRLGVDVDSVQRSALRTELTLAHNLPLAKNHALRAEFGLALKGSEQLRRGKLSYRYYF